MLLQLLQQSMGDVENAEIEATFKQAPELNYKLVRLFAHHSTGDFPSPLLQMAAARGRLMELLSEQVRRPQDRVGRLRRG